jgi:glycosyltransferase involved in cell wall biosynthesis
MDTIKLSVIIPDYKDPLLIKTIDSLLENSELGTALEIIAVIDGYEPEFALKEDPRVRYIKLGKNRGMRGAINAGVALARGEFIMRTDEHCIFGKGYDRILTETCEPNWIVTARRYFLDPVKWEVMEDKGYVDYEKLVIQDEKKFSGSPWASRTEERKDTMIDETMAMQGSMWLMPRAWWEKVIVELDTINYGPLIQDSHEMQFKTWQAGGKLMLNKNTWFAHKHRDFPRTHNNGTPENPADQERGYAYALSQWKDYYLKEIAPKWFPS